LEIVGWVLSAAGLVSLWLALRAEGQGVEGRRVLRTGEPAADGD
jgi:hypothetical protein